MTQICHLGWSLSLSSSRVKDSTMGSGSAVPFSSMKRRSAVDFEDLTERSRRKSRPSQQAQVAVRGSTLLANCLRVSLSRLASA